MLNESLLEVKELPLNKEDKQALIGEYLHQLQNTKQHFLGYQTNQHCQLSDEIKPFLTMNLLNLGDGFEDGDYRINAKVFERAIIQFYARLWHLSGTTKNEHISERQYWGYLTNMGATEGNLCALWNAREYLSQAFTKTPVVLFSERTHYSINKACRLLQLDNMADIGSALGACPIRVEDATGIKDSSKSWPRAVPVNADGSIHIPALRQLAEFFVAQGHPIILNLNLGTTFNGAFDDIPLAIQQLQHVLKQENSSGQRNYWLHVDGALAANYIPFIELNAARSSTPNSTFSSSRKQASTVAQSPIPGFDFRYAQVMSISVSPYKWLGSPWPYGLFMTRRSLYSAGAHRPHYIGSYDTTLSGSRNGFSALLLWDKVTRLGTSGLIALSQQIEQLTQYAYQQLQTLEQLSDTCKQVLCLQPRIPHANIIVFKAPSQGLMQRFSLCSDLQQINGQSMRMSHLVILEHVSHSTIDLFVTALKQELQAQLEQSPTSKLTTSQKTKPITLI
ncbi:glutamate decarboxylase [Saccharobesus litoralis]|uniref:Glutamate decarboxylase n=1 Tax=Saccharobesus litoralis TaxID=2172099 RepID=A0A2S0VQU3_9ALTE|nr:pyridoxal-dependent decarboxylase [Saccharobesus litoralis]AWB66583.1 glutamate decarboxylase [Saccharobesus litoralis]